MTTTLQPRRAALFVGALVLEGLGATLASGADLACIDLEDAVPPGRKAEARAALLSALADCTVPAGVQLVVRINALTDPDGTEDLRVLMAEARAVGGVLLPKVDDPEEVREAGDYIDATRPEIDLYAIVETAKGLEHCVRIAQSHPRLKAIFFGGFDLSTALGCDMAWEPLLYARSRVVHAGALAGLPVIDSPYPDVLDAMGLQAECARVKALGMAGKTAKHASQVATIREAFTPTPAEAARARAILAIFDADPTRPLVYEGKLVEQPTVKRLRRLVGP